MILFQSWATAAAAGHRERNLQKPFGKNLSRFLLHGNVVEEVADALAVVGAADGLAKDLADVDDAQLGAALDLVAEGHGVGHDDAGQAAVVERLDGVAAEDAVGDDGDDWDTSEHKERYR